METTEAADDGDELEPPTAATGDDATDESDDSSKGAK